jgi:hypothetical protein
VGQISAHSYIDLRKHKDYKELISHRVPHQVNGMSSLRTRGQIYTMKAPRVHRQAQRVRHGCEVQKLSWDRYDENNLRPDKDAGKRKGRAPTV